MGNKRISDLANLPVPKGEDIFPIVNQGTTRHINLDDFFRYADDFYFKSGKAPFILDDLVYRYFRFKDVSGNFIVSGSQMFRVLTGIFQVEQSGIFNNHLTGVKIDGFNLSGQNFFAQNALINQLTTTGNVSSLNITGKDLDISGSIDVCSGINIFNSSNINTVRFGPNIRVHQTGLFNESLGIHGSLYISDDLTVNDIATFKNNFYVTGNDIRFHGNTIIGIDANSTLQVNADLTSDLVPDFDYTGPGDLSSYDLGIPSKRWETVYAGKGIFHEYVNISGGRLNVNGDSYLTGSAIITQNLFVGSNFTGSGNNVLGASTSNRLTVNARVNSDFVPSTSQANNLGSSSLLWKDAYLTNLFVTGDSILGDSTSDRISVVGLINTDLDPNQTNVRDLGADNLFWRNAYIGTIVNSGLNVRGNVNVTGTTTINGHFAATSKSFSIPHPLDSSKTLQYGSLEGPENGVYIRGKTNSNIITLPDYWKELVHEDSITVHLTSKSQHNNLYVLEATNEKIIVGGNNFNEFYYIIYGERKDISKLIVEY